MSPEQQIPDHVDQAIRHALAARVSTVLAEPDVNDLRRRIDRAEAHGGVRVRRVGAVAAVLVAATVGGTLGSVLTPVRPEHALFSSGGGDQNGSLPSAPGSHRHHAGSGEGLRMAKSDAPAGGLAAAPIVTTRTTAAGAHLVAVAMPLPPVAVTSGLQPAGCYAGELITTSVAKGSASASATGVARIQPLASNGLEVVNSGTVPSSGGLDLWWATVAVGSGVARVAAEEPGGTTDAMKPQNGIAVVGGVTPASATPRFFSVVAENASGLSLHSIGFLTGWGPEAAGAAGSSGLASTAASAAQPQAVRSCEKTLGSGQQASTLGSQPAAPLLAAASVVAAFHQEYRSAGPVDVSRISFLSARQAEVIYRVGTGLKAPGRLRSGAALLRSDGVWRVAGWGSG